MQALRRYKVGSRRECYQFLTDLLTNGYEKQDYLYIFNKLDYNFKSVMKIIKNRKSINIENNNDFADNSRRLTR